MDWNYILEIAGALKVSFLYVNSVTPVVLRNFNAVLLCCFFMSI